MDVDAARPPLLRVEVRRVGVAHVLDFATGGDVEHLAEDGKAQLAGGHARHRFGARVVHLGGDAVARARGVEVPGVDPSGPAVEVHPAALKVPHPAVFVALVELRLQAVVVLVLGRHRIIRESTVGGFQRHRHVVARGGNLARGPRQRSVGVEHHVRVGHPRVRRQEARESNPVDGHELSLDLGHVFQRHDHSARAVGVFLGHGRVERGELADRSDLVVAGDGVVVDKREIRRNHVLGERRHWDGLHDLTLAVSRVDADHGFHHSHRLRIVLVVQVLDGHELELDLAAGAHLVREVVLAGEELFPDTLARQFRGEFRGGAVTPARIPRLRVYEKDVVGLVVRAAHLGGIFPHAPFGGVVDVAPHTPAVVRARVGEGICPERVLVLLARGVGERRVHLDPPIVTAWLHELDDTIRFASARGAPAGLHVDGRSVGRLQLDVVDREARHAAVAVAVAVAFVQRHVDGDRPIGRFASLRCRGHEHRGENRREHRCEHRGTGGPRRHGSRVAQQSVFPRERDVTRGVSPKLPPGRKTLARFREILLFVARATMGSSVRGEECLGRLAPYVNVDMVFVTTLTLAARVSSPSAKIVLFPD